MTLKSDAKIKEKRICNFKDDIRNLVNFHPTTQKFENVTFTGSFWPKYKDLRQKTHTGAIFHDTEQWCKIWTNLNLAVSKLACGIGWTFIKALKNLKICPLMGSFCPKHNVLARKFHRNYVSWHWKVMQNLSENWLVDWKSQGIWLIFMRQVESLKICTW